MPGPKFTKILVTVVISGWSNYWCIFIFLLILFCVSQVVGSFFHHLAHFIFIIKYFKIILIAIKGKNEQIENVYLQLTM